MQDSGDNRSDSSKWLAPWSIPEKFKQDAFPAVKKTNHENTKSKKHEIYCGLFRDFALS